LVYSRFYSSILPARILLAGNAMNGRRQMHRDDSPRDATLLIFHLKGNLWARGPYDKW